MNKNDVDLLLKNGFIQKAIDEVASLDEPGQSEVTKAILDKCVEKGWVTGVWKVVVALVRGLTQRDIEIMLDKCTAEGWPGGVRIMKLLLKRKLTSEEFEVIFNGYASDGLLGDIQEVTRLLSSLNYLKHF